MIEYDSHLFSNNISYYNNGRLFLN